MPDLSGLSFEISETVIRIGAVYMSDMTELRARYEFRKAALTKLREAYLALVDGGVKSYMIDDRQLTRFDLPDLKAEIERMEDEVDELATLLSGRKPRKAVGIVLRDW